MNLDQLPRLNNYTPEQQSEIKSNMLNAWQIIVELSEAAVDTNKELFLGLLKTFTDRLPYEFKKLRDKYCLIISENNTPLTITIKQLQEYKEELETLLTATMQPPTKLADDE